MKTPRIDSEYSIGLSRHNIKHGLIDAGKDPQHLQPADFEDFHTSVLAGIAATRTRTGGPLGRSWPVSTGWLVPRRTGSGAASEPTRGGASVDRAPGRHAVVDRAGDGGQG